MLKLQWMLWQAVQLFLMAGLGAFVGVRVAFIANVYVRALAAGAAPDAALMRNAILQGLYWPWISTVRGVGIRAPEAASAPMARDPFAIPCAMLMACLYVLLYSLHRHHLLYLIAMVLASVMLLALALIDMRSRLLPDSLTLPLMWLGLLLAWSGHGVVLADAVAGAMMGYGVLWSLFCIFKALTGHEGMGYGDFKLLAALGAWLGWQPLAGVVLAACSTGVLFVVLRQRTWRPSGSYPFGPFLGAGGMAALLLGSEVHLYF
ncbi:prepilin peptidase [Candidimonas sp. SYP-B2681]|uniref:prepilin peptidase n=1 Tax=Candidimonas sp. SYP-B2681 TaxID=2497686 RepID=UPI000F86D0E1|nr:A24 family peptidase [Candidimonas sp. SYP-B2681]RTZ41755.1 prepilin peptidase [Candidimonas sp. SYP-B2681]